MKGRGWIERTLEGIRCSTPSSRPAFEGGDRVPTVFLQTCLHRLFKRARIGVPLIHAISNRPRRRVTVLHQNKPSSARRAGIATPDDCVFWLTRLPPPQLAARRRPKLVVPVGALIPRRLRRKPNPHKAGRRYHSIKPAKRRIPRAIARGSAIPSARRSRGAASSQKVAQPACIQNVAKCGINRPSS